MFGVTFLWSPSESERPSLISTQRRLFHFEALSLAAREFIIEGILLARRQPARYLGHNLNDLPHHIAAVATNGDLEQVANRRADFRSSIVGAREIAIVLI
jgi:hypothetical protein